MSPRLGGALLVLLAAAAAAVPPLRVLVGPAAIVWFLCVRRSHEASLVLVLLVAVGMRLPFAFHGAVSDDVHRYLWEGRVQLAGHSPYQRAPSDPALAHLRGPSHARINHPELPTIYPPLAQLAFRGAAALGLSGPGWRNAVLLLDALTVAVLLGWLRASGRPPGWALLYAWCPVVACGAAVGHYEPLMLLLLAACGWAWERRRSSLAGALLGAAVLAKTVAVLLLPWMLLRRPRAALVAAAVVVGGYLPHAGGDPFGTLLAFGSEFAFNASFFRAAEWIAPESAHGVVAALLAFWVAVVTVTQPRFASAAALLLAGLLLLSPTVHYWYLGWFLLFLGAAGPRTWTWPLLLWAVTSVFSFETYRRSYDGEGFAERFALTWAVYLPPLALAAWLLWRHRPLLRPPPAPAARAAPGRFAVVIPCRGEAANLRRLLPAWLGTAAERVVVADTPAGDGTERLAAGDPRLRYLPVREPGYGAAVAAGLAAIPADVDFAVVCDADHGRGPEQVASLLAPFSDPGVGLVTAARDPSELSWPQRAGNRFVAFLVALGWGRRFHDLGPFRALRLARWPAGALTDRGFGWNVEMNVRALELGMGVVEVALPASRREHGRNRISGTASGVVRAGLGILRQLYRLREESCARPSSS